jgi:hypothetical protein
MVGVICSDLGCSCEFVVLGIDVVEEDVVVVAVVEGVVGCGLVAVCASINADNVLVVRRCGYAVLMASSYS